MADVADTQRARLAPRRVRDVAEVTGSLATDIHQRFPGRLLARGIAAECVWSDGAVAFSLLDADAAGRAARLEVTLEGTHFASVTSELSGEGLTPRLVLAAGQAVVLVGRLAFRPELGRLQLRMEAVDLPATEALLARRRDVARAALAGRADAQRSLARPRCPLRVAIVADPGSDAYVATRDRLAGSGFTVDQRLYPAAVEGDGAVEAVAGALTAAERDRRSVVLAVRDPARRMRLAAFDTPAVAGAVVDARVPVITGLGAGGEPTVADDVAHAATPSGEAAADVVLGWLTAALEELEGREVRVRRAAYDALGRARSDEEAAATRVEQAHARAQERAGAWRRGRLWRWLLLLVAVALLAAALTALEVAWPFTAGITVAAAGGGALALWLPTALRIRRAKEAAMPVDDLSFDDALRQLDDVRDRLDDARRPEEIAGLMAQADELSRRCRTLLGRAGEAIARHESAQ